MKYGGILISSECKINHFNIQHKCVNMRHIYVNIQHNYVDIQHNYVNMQAAMLTYISCNVNITMLHDNLIYLACIGQMYATIIVTNIDKIKYRSIAISIR